MMPDLVWFYPSPFIPSVLLSLGLIKGHGSILPPTGVKNGVKMGYIYIYEFSLLQVLLLNLCQSQFHKACASSENI